MMFQKVSCDYKCSVTGCNDSWLYYEQVEDVFLERRDLLKQITDMANVTCADSVTDAFQATQSVEAYEFFEKMYDSTLLQN